ncbi:MAG: hypothetical protein EOL87_06325 [Spartobacteria bacterium]|nr:hypothetical protein [Spartobacteria bacterium]
METNALGLEKGFVPEDSVRRGMKKVTDDCWDECQRWLSKAELALAKPVLAEPNILDPGL